MTCNKHFLNLSASVFFVTVILLFSGCGKYNLYEPGNISDAPITVEESRNFVQRDLESIDELYLNALAQDYVRFGVSGMRVSVTYNPADENGARAAQKKLDQIVTTLSRGGVSGLQASIVPVHRAQDQNQFLAVFNQAQAKPPEDCQLMSGLEDNDIGNIFDMKFGCTTDTLLARQVSHPGDLAGKDLSNSKSPARRAANMTEPYHAGVPNPPLQGESASGD